MGWDSSDSWKSKADVVKECLENITRNNFEILTYKSTRSGLWTVVRNMENNTRSIFFDLIERSQGRLYVKSMDERCGPSYYDCPLSFFDLVCPETNSQAINTAWREKVRAKQSIAV